MFSQKGDAKWEIMIILKNWLTRHMLLLLLSRFCANVKRSALMIFFRINRPIDWKLKTVLQNETLLGNVQVVLFLVLYVTLGVS